MRIIGIGKFIKQNTGGKITVPEPTFHQIKALNLEMTRIEIYEDPILQQTNDDSTTQTNQ